MYYASEEPTISVLLLLNPYFVYGNARHVSFRRKKESPAIFISQSILSYSIAYNILNLPKQVLVNGLTISYHYDGSGKKLRMANSNNTVNAKYAGIFEYNEENRAALR